MNARRASWARPLFLSAILALAGWSASAQPQLLFPDGDFGQQTIGLTVGFPWGPVGGGNTVTAASQSPYTNVYANNGQGVNFPASAGNPYIVTEFTDIPTGTAENLYFNIDFRNNDSAEPGDYSIVITHGASGAAISVAFYVTANALYAESSGTNGTTYQLVMNLQTNTWYNLQATLNLAAQTYSATVYSPLSYAGVPTQPFVVLNQDINSVYTDGGTSHIPGAAPNHDFDNWALSSTPLAPVTTGPVVQSVAPLGTSVTVAAPVVISLQDGATQVASGSIQLTVNGTAVTPTVSKPAGTNVTTITYAPSGGWLPGTYNVTLVFSDTSTPAVSSTNGFSFTVPGVQVTSTAPAGPGALPGSTIQIQLANKSTRVVTNSIQLLLNGAAVAPSVSQTGTNLTTVTYAPAAGFAYGSSNFVTIVFNDNSTPPVSTTNQFSFEVVQAPVSQLLNTDGDFSAQTLGLAVGTPWGPVGGGNTVTAAAQSPYTNVYANNGKGANFPASAGNPYIVDEFTDIPSGTDELLYFNLDFRNHDNAEPGDYSVVITHNASGAQRSVAFYVTPNGLYAESSGGNGATSQLVLPLQTNTWYNLQATLDLGSQTYSAVVYSPLDYVVLPSRPFVIPGQDINCVYTDGGTSLIPGAAPNHDLDNWTVSSGPLPPVPTGPFVVSASPRGSGAAAGASIDLVLEDYNTTVAPNSINLTLNGVAVTPVVSKPAGSTLTTVTYTPSPTFRPGNYTVGFSFADTSTPPVVTSNQFSFTVPAGVQVGPTLPLGPGTATNSTIQILLTNVYTQVVTNSIQLVLNGQAVTPTIVATSTNLTTVSFVPPAGLASGSSNTVAIIFDDNSTPPVVITNQFSFEVVNTAVASEIVNISFQGQRNVPGPRGPGPLFIGIGAGGGGQVFNGLLADSALPGNNDNDNLTVAGTNLLNSIGLPTQIGFTASPLGGDYTGSPTASSNSATALFNNYVFNDSAGNKAGQVPFTISGLGSAPTVTLYFYISAGVVSVPGAVSTPYPGSGIFTPANTLLFLNVPVTNGTVNGTIGSGGLDIINGLSIVQPLPQPFLLSESPTGAGIAPNAAITIQLEDYVTAVQTNKIQLLVNGQTVSPAISKPSGTNITTVTYTPAAPFAQGAAVSVEIIFGDNSSPTISQTNQFSFSVLNQATAALIVNVDFDGQRNNPVPRGPGPAFVGVGPAGGGRVWNDMLAISALADGTDDDNITVGGTNLLNSLGNPTAVGLTVSPVGGDDSAPAGTDPSSAAALFDKYIFVGSAAQVSGMATFTLSGLGTNATANLYVLVSAGTVTVTGVSNAAPFSATGIFTPGNTVFFPQVPIVQGSISGTLLGKAGVFPGLTVDLSQSAALPPGPLSIALSTGSITISWPGPGTLQSATSVTGPWTDMAGSSPATISLGGTTKFFRLRQ